MAGRGRGAALTVPAWMKDRAAAEAPALASAAAPADAWARAVAPGGRPYWFQRSTGKTTWTDPGTGGGAGRGAPAPLASTGPSAQPLAAPVAAPAPAPQQLWAKVVGANDGRPYYYNKTTRETRWTAPPGFVEEKPVVARAAPGVAVLPLPEGWVEYKTPAGKPYFHSAKVGKTVWTRPVRADGSAGAAAPVAVPAVVRPPVAQDIGVKRPAPAPMPGMVPPVKRRKTRTRAPPRGYVARPKDKDGVRFLGDREAEAYFLGRARKERERLAEVNRRARIAGGKGERGVVGAKKIRAEERQGASKAACEYVHVKKVSKETEWGARERFEAVMKDSGATSTSSWLETMARCTPDERYDVDIKTYGHRKLAYSNYVAKLARVKREGELIQKLKGEKDFTTLMGECFRDEPSHVLGLENCRRGNVERFEADPRHAAVGGDARADMIREFFRSRGRAAKEEELSKRRKLVEGLRAHIDAATDPTLRRKKPPPGISSGVKNGLGDADVKPEGEKLKAKRWLTDRSSLTEAESRVRHTTEYEELSAKERADVFHAWLDDVRVEATEAARSARKSIVHGIDVMAAEGRISPRASWKEVADKIFAEPFAKEAIERDYVPAPAFAPLFRDGVGLFYKRVDCKSDDFRGAFRAAASNGLDILDETLSSTYLRKNPLFAPVLEGVPVGVADALLQERRKKEARRKDAAIGEFESLLRRRDVDGRTDWGSLKESILERTVYKQLREALGSDGAVESLFRAFVERRESRRRRTQDSQPPPPRSSGDGGKRVSPVENGRPKFPVNPPLPRQTAKRDEDSGWAAALSTKDSDGGGDAKRKEERERRKRAIIAASASGDSIGK